MCGVEGVLSKKENEGRSLNMREREEMDWIFVLNIVAIWRN